MRKILLFTTFTLLLFYPALLASRRSGPTGGSFTLNEAFAKKKIIRQGTTSQASSGRKLVVRPRLRNDRRALTVNFSNLQAVSSFSYELMYTTNNIPQGVAGTITPAGETQTKRELLFGTCSKNVCRYHSGISGMKFTVTSTLKSGVKVRQTFRVKP